jgi:hypothetical protein
MPMPELAIPTQTSSPATATAWGAVRERENLGGSGRLVAIALPSNRLLIRQEGSVRTSP